ncbi:pentatricopeptide repeat-containing protein At3g09650, chloroplastic [Phalaenopsis equestris]|uniref:pentatricopeptide repeat-containing protein At3g09650, chloroplastic n=1 Tax=Phalaenopsis equestris TaxID=78828 RepID=UPI0009E39696|nr:pentatricopeptide repeat-containing protein At3g09650, chloroplastic [Phalaenopsis equestris]
MLPPSPQSPATSYAPLPPLHLFSSSTKPTQLLLPPSHKPPRRFYHQIGTQTSSSPAISSSSSSSSHSHDAILLDLLRQGKTEEAYQLYSSFPHIPDSTSLSRLLSQLAYQRSPTSLSRAQSLVRRLRDARLLRRLDSNSLGLLAVAAAKSGAASYSLSIIHSMLRSGYLPHVKSWSAVISALSSTGDPVCSFDALRLVLRRIAAADPSLTADSLPDTAAFNAALNAASNLGDAELVDQLLDKMPVYEAKPDVITYNVLIKLFARAERGDLLVFVLERIIRSNLVPCITTFHSLVAAFVGLGDLRTAEKLVQSLREGRLDICHLLRAEIPSRSKEEETSSILNKLADIAGDDAPPLLPKTYSPDTRIYAGAGEDGGGGFRPDEGLLDALADVCVRAAFFRKALEIVACMEENGIAPKKTKYKRIYVEMHSRMFTSKHASPARKARRSERKRAAEAFKFWLGLPNSYYGSEWRLEPIMEDD